MDGKQWLSAGNCKRRTWTDRKTWVDRKNVTAVDCKPPVVAAPLSSFFRDPSIPWICVSPSCWTWCSQNMPRVQTRGLIADGAGEMTPDLANHRGTSGVRWACRRSFGWIITTRSLFISCRVCVFCWSFFCDLLVIMTYVWPNPRTIIVTRACQPGASSNLLSGLWSYFSPRVPRHAATFTQSYARPELQVPCLLASAE